MAKTRSHDRLSSSTHGPTTRPASSSVVLPFFRSRSSILSTPPDAAKSVLGLHPVALGSKRVKFRGIRRIDRHARPARHENSWARPRRREGLTTKLGGRSVGCRAFPSGSGVYWGASREPLPRLLGPR